MERQKIEGTILRRTILQQGYTQAPASSPVPYPFVPIAGTEWNDRFVKNFVDLDPGSPGVLDWDCTGFTYDGHQGHDIDLRSFGEQDVGVPVFAALDGIVADANDGEYDRNTFMANQRANYVVLYHGGTHYTWYYHLRNGSVAVRVGQFLKAGTQIGLAASSGNSTGPHLHFESRSNGTYYEPSAGACRPGQSYWVNQIPIPRNLSIEDFGMHNTNSFPVKSFFPYNPPRAGTFVQSGTSQPIGAWYIIHNLPANSTWRVRYLRPDATLFYDSGVHGYENPPNPFYRSSSWWMWRRLDPDTAGTWTFELSVNESVMVNAPFTIINSDGIPTNHPPASVTASFEPPQPTTNDVLFCRIKAPMLADPDYDLISYRFQWQVNGVVIRQVTNAAHADAIPRASASPGDLIACTVTPYDGQLFGLSANAQTFVEETTPTRLAVQSVSVDQVLVTWPASSINYILEQRLTLGTTNGWTPVTNSSGLVRGQIVVTNTAADKQRFFRLRWP